ncbi:MAG: glycosyltransferase family 4 protein [Acidimicrobiales bacterium]
MIVLQDCTDVTAVQRAMDDYLSVFESGGRHVALTLDGCDWGSFDIETAALIYRVLEFATSLKPALLRFFLSQGWDRVTYLDPDIQLFNDFSSLLNDDKAVSLTPHFFSDIPDDGFRPTTNDVLQAGYYNLGFCSVRPSAAPFLDWWSDRLQFDCLVEPASGFFTDQKILDLAPLKTDLQVLTEPGCNVAYWNLHERYIRPDGDGWRVDYDDAEYPLYFFHFSGFPLGPSSTLSIHASRRIVGEAVPRRFAEQYAMQRIASEPEAAISFTLGGTTFDFSVPVLWRTIMRDDVRAHARAGHSLPEIRTDIYYPRPEQRFAPCAACGLMHDTVGYRAEAYLSGWACHPAIDGVPNGISAIFRQKGPLYDVTPLEQLAWAPLHLATWFTGNEPLLEEILKVAQIARSNTVDIRLVGYFTYPASTGQLAHWTLQAWDAAGITPALDYIPLERVSDEYLSRILRRRNPVAATGASVLCIVNADQWDYLITQAQRVDSTLEVAEALWAWELEEIPDAMSEIAARGDLVRVLALSNWSAEAMARALAVPTQRFAPFDLGLIEELIERASAAHQGPRSSPYLLMTFDTKSILSRKNPQGVLEVWRRIHEDYPTYRLVIKSDDLRELAPLELLDLIDASPRTELIDYRLEDDQYATLLAGCDVYISLHRSEGMGLTPIEAGLCGRPVVYTNYGGVSEYLDGGFFPVCYTMTQVGASGEDCGPYNAEAWWADPDLDDAERQVRNALAVSGSETALSSLATDRKQLCENLIAAQVEVVNTALRLIEQAAVLRSRAPEQSSESVVAAIVTTSPNASSSNVFLHKLVAWLYAVYRHLPCSFRRQCNLALIKLRRLTDG